MIITLTWKTRIGLGCSASTPWFIVIQCFTFRALEEKQKINDSNDEERGVFSLPDVQLCGVGMYTSMHAGSHYLHTLLHGRCIHSDPKL